jgi:hypothetical protein
MEVKATTIVAKAAHASDFFGLHRLTQDAFDGPGDQPAFEMTQHPANRLETSAGHAFLDIDMDEVGAHLRYLDHADLEAVAQGEEVIEFF